MMDAHPWWWRFTAGGFILLSMCLIYEITMWMRVNEQSDYLVLSDTFRSRTPVSESVAALLHVMRIVMPPCIWGHGGLICSYCIFQLWHAVPQASLSVNYAKEMTGLIVSGTARIQHQGVACWEGERRGWENKSWERSSVPLLVPPVDKAAPIHSPLQPDRKARQSKNIMWNFITVWQYIWLAWHWLKPPTLHISMTLQKAQSTDSAGCTPVAARKWVVSTWERHAMSLPTNSHCPEPVRIIFVVDLIVVERHRDLSLCLGIPDPSGVPVYEECSLFN